MKKKIAVFFGGKSCEHDISIITALQAMKHLDKRKYEVCPVYIKDGFYIDGLRKISEFTPFISENHTKVYFLDGVLFECGKKLKRKFKPDVAVLCTHGGDGENGRLQGLLEVENIPYTSTGVLGSAVCMNKSLSKEVFENMLLNVVKHMVISREDYYENGEKVASEIETVLEYPIIIKPSSLGSSIGIEVAKSREELIHALDVAVCFDKEIVAERALTDFVEINCAAASDGEETIVSETECPFSWSSFLTYEEKYMGGGKMSSGEKKIPAPVDDAVNNEVKETTRRLYQRLDLKGVVRMDYLYDKSANKVYLNEINTIPGSLSFYLFEPLGISYEELLDKMIDGAVAYHKKEQENSFEFKSTVLDSFAGVKK